MPYKRIGQKIYRKRKGKWELKQTAENIPNAKAALRLLRGIEGGEWRPTGKKSFTTVRRHRRKGRKVRKHKRNL